MATLREQPGDLVEFASQYFSSLLEHRDAGEMGALSGMKVDEDMESDEENIDDGMYVWRIDLLGIKSSLLSLLIRIDQFQEIAHSYRW